MGGTRVLVGTRKGAFVLTSDRRAGLEGRRPALPGHGDLPPQGVAAEPRPDLRLAVQRVVRAGDPPLGRRRLDVGDGGQRLHVRRRPGEHQWYDGSLRDWAFTRVWHLEPSCTTLTRSTRASRTPPSSSRPTAAPTWTELSALRKHDTGPQWQPGAGGMCLHTILLDPSDQDRLYVAISAAGAFRTDDGGQTWQPINKGLRSGEIPDQDSEVGHCVHRIDMHPSNPDVLYMQKHWDVMRSKDGGDSWREVSGNLPSDFGFPIAVHAHEPETIYVVPIQSDS